MITLPFRILVPGAVPIATQEFSHTHEVEVAVEHAADDQPYQTGCVSIREFTYCRVHVLDLLPCPHGWRYDDFSRAMARNDTGGMLEALVAAVPT